MGSALTAPSEVMYLLAVCGMASGVMAVHVALAVMLERRARREWRRVQAHVKAKEL